MRLTPRSEAALFTIRIVNCGNLTRQCTISCPFLNIRGCLLAILDMPVLPDSKRLELLNLLQAQPQLSQRDLARTMGVSLGKANYCLKALMDKGLVKLGNFHRNPDKREYAYLLTAAGLEEKTRITLAFLKRKVVEYEALKKEIEQLRGELKNHSIQFDARSDRPTENR